MSGVPTVKDKGHFHLEKSKKKTFLYTWKVYAKFHDDHESKCQKPNKQALFRIYSSNIS